MPCDTGDNIEISCLCPLSSLTKSNTTIFPWLDAQTFLEQTLSSEKLSRLALEHRSRLATKLSFVMKEYENHQMEMYIDMSPALKSFFHSPDASSSDNGSEKEQGKKKKLRLNFGILYKMYLLFITSTWFRRVLRCSKQRFGPWIRRAPGRRSVRRPYNYKFFTTGSWDEEKRIYASPVKISE